MRTKTMILSAVLGALTSASVMAQVYSLNAVGYMNVVCPPGFSIIANQLNTTNNTIGSLINIADTNNGTTEGCILFKFVNGAYIQAAIVSANNVTPSNAGGWGPASTTNYTLNPGEAAFFYNSTAINGNNAQGFPITLTFVGTVVTGNALTVNLNSGFNLVSSIVPQSAGISSTMGIVPSGYNAQTSTDPNAGGDEVFLFSTNGTAYQQTKVENDNAQNAPNDYWNPSEPVPLVGQGFFYYNSATVSESWTRAFQVGP